jgi:uncharacterized protein
MSPLQLFFVGLVGVLSGFIGAVAGGGGLISIPLLIFLGVPPQVTLATNKFGGLGMSAGALTKFIKEKKVVWKYTIPLSVLGICASLIGSRILISTKGTSLNTLIAILMLVGVPIMLMKKNFGSIGRQTSGGAKWFGYFLYFSISIIASFFGGIGGLLIVTVVWFIGLPMIEANATDLVGYTVMSISAVIIYGTNGLIEYSVGFVLLAGMLLGGYIGAHTAIKKGNTWVKVFFSVVIVASAVKLLFS